MSGSEKFDKQSVETEFGQKVTVDREENVVTEESQRAAKMLLDAAGTLNPRKDVLEHLGSAAVHVYRSPMLGQLFIMSQLPLGKMSAELGSEAIKALKNDMLAAYGMKRKVRRSGL